MKKQLLLLLALISCANVSAQTSWIHSLENLVKNNKVETAATAAFLAIASYFAYKFITNGVHPSTTSLINTKEEEKSDFILEKPNRELTAFSTTQVETPAQELAPVETFAAQEEFVLAPAHEAAPVVTAEQLEELVAAVEEITPVEAPVEETTPVEYPETDIRHPEYFDNLVEYQMDHLS